MTKTKASMNSRLGKVKERITELESGPGEFPDRGSQKSKTCEVIKLK